MTIARPPRQPPFRKLRELRSSVAILQLFSISASPFFANSLLTFSVEHIRWMLALTFTMYGGIISTPHSPQNLILGRGEICPSRQSRRECKISCQRCKFLHFHSFFVFFLTKTVKIRWNWRCKIFILKIRRCKILDKFHVCATKWGPLAKLWGVQKNKHGHNFQF